MLISLIHKKSVICIFFIVGPHILFGSQKEFKSVRNPFSKSLKRESKKTCLPKLTLVGIVTMHGESCAIIAMGKEHVTVQAGQIINGYCIKNVGNNVVVLQRGKKEKKLFLD